MTNHPKPYSTAILRFAATEVSTPWFMWLDPNAVATGNPDWIDCEWFDPTLDGTAPVLVGSAWDYARPANRFQQLDDWGDRISELRDLPRLNHPFDSTEDHIRIPTISSWCLLGETSWIKACVDDFAQGALGGLDEIYVHYCALRQQLRVHRIAFKRLGWDHSFGWSAPEVIRKCQQAAGNSIVESKIALFIHERDRRVGAPYHKLPFRWRGWFGLDSQFGPLVTGGS